MKRLYLILLFAALFSGSVWAQSLTQSSLPIYVDALPSPNVCISTTGTRKTKQIQALIFVAGDGLYGCVNNVYAKQTGAGGGGVSSLNTRTGVVTLTQTDVGLSNVDNTADANKPVSTAQAAAINAKVGTVVAGTNITVSRAGDAVTINSTATGGAGGAATGNETLVGAETLQQAITRIGVVNKVILDLTNTANTLSADLTVPENIRLQLAGGAYFTSSNNAKLIIKNGGGLAASPDQWLFRGSLDVQFPNSYPDVIYPQWFGAICNDRGVNGASTSDTPNDDYAAIQAAIRSFRNDSNFPTFSRYAHGGKIKITGACYSSQTLKIYTNIELVGINNLEFSVSRVRFPKNTTGFLAGLTDRTDSEQPQPYARNGGNLKINNLFLLGDYDFTSNIVPVNVSGLTVTNPAGATFSYRDGYAIAEPLDIDGMLWAIGLNAGVAGAGDSITPVNTLTLRPFGFTANGNGTANQLITDRFQFPQSWVGASIEIEGVANTITAVVAVDPIRSRITLQNAYLDINGAAFVSTGGLEGRIMGLAPQTNKPSILRRYPGIDLRSVAIIENVAIRGFGGDGIYQGLSGPTTNSATEPNTSNTIIRNVKFDFNRGSGSNVNYANANVVLFEKGNANYNDLYGASEESQLGNKYTSWHVSFSGQNNYSAGVAQTNGSNFDSCYMEDGGVPINIQNNVVWHYGTPSRFSYYSRGVVILPTLTRSLEVSGISYSTAKKENYGIFGVAARFGNKDLPYIVSSDGVTNDQQAINDSSGLSFHTRYVNYGNVSSPQIMRQFLYGSPTQGVVTGNILFESTTSTVTGGAGRFGFPNGFYLGNYYTGSNLSADSNGIAVDKSFHLINGNVYVENFNKGIILKSPDGTCYLYKASNGGTLAGTTITCP